MKQFVAEFIGTFTLIFVGVGSIAANQMTNGALGLTGIALAHGLAIAVMASATGAISGGHLNPAVTLGAIMGGKIGIPDAVKYWVAQLGGSFAAAVLIKIAMPAAALTAVKMGTPALGEGVTAVQGVVMEAVITFFLIFVVYGTAIDKRAPKMAALFIGLTVALDIMVAGPITGGAINPARHFGPALLGGGLQNFWIYWVGPMIGGALAGLVYHNVLEEK